MDPYGSRRTAVTVLAAPCVTVTVCPAMVRVPTRWGPVFDNTEKEIKVLPLPELVKVVIQALFEEDSHPHPVVVETVTEAALKRWSKVKLDGVTEKLQPGAKGMIVNMSLASLFSEPPPVTLAELYPGEGAVNGTSA